MRKMRGMWLAACLAVVGLAVLAWQGRKPAHAQPLLVAEDESVAQVAARLEAGGLKLQLIPATADGDCTNAYLTKDNRTWGELNCLSKTPEKIELWTGAVYCERVNQPGSRDLQIATWGDCCLQAGPFLFFGDPKLIVRIRETLSVQRDGSPSTDG